MAPREPRTHLALGLMSFLLVLMSQTYIPHDWSQSRGRDIVTTGLCIPMQRAISVPRHRGGGPMSKEFELVCQPCLVYASIWHAFVCRDRGDGGDAIPDRTEESYLLSLSS